MSRTTGFVIFGRNVNAPLGFTARGDLSFTQPPEVFDTFEAALDAVTTNHRNAGPLTIKRQVEIPRVQVEYEEIK